MRDLQALSTPELKTLIRRQDDEQEEAILELCTRHDAGDLVKFLTSLKFQPADILGFLDNAHGLGICWAVAGAAVSLSAGAARAKYWRNKSFSSSRITSSGSRRLYRVGFEVDAALLAHIDNEARERGNTRSDFLRHTVEEWFANHAV